MSEPSAPITRWQGTITATGLRALARPTALRGIPYGETVSYGEIARDLGHPDAARAVGRANARNPVAVIVPCHRVIGADGSLTGYAGGLDNKRLLLELEAKHSPAAAERLFA